MPAIHRRQVAEPISGARSSAGPMDEHTQVPDVEGLREEPGPTARGQLAPSQGASARQIASSCALLLVSRHRCARRCIIRLLEPSPANRAPQQAYAGWWRPPCRTRRARRARAGGTTHLRVLKPRTRRASCSCAWTRGWSGSTTPMTRGRCGRWFFGDCCGGNSAWCLGPPRQCHSTAWVSRVGERLPRCELLCFSRTQWAEKRERKLRKVKRRVRSEISVTGGDWQRRKARFLRSGHGCTCRPAACRLQTHPAPALAAGLHPRLPQHERTPRPPPARAHPRHHSPGVRGAV